MEDIEIALALLEMVVIMLPLTLAAFGLMIRLQQSLEVSEVLGVGRPLGLGFAALLVLLLLALAGFVLGLFLSRNIQPPLVQFGVVLLAAVFGLFAGFTSRILLGTGISYFFL